MSDLEDFIREHNLRPGKSKKSVLQPYADEIFKMKEMGFTEKIILQFLKEKKGIVVSQQTLNWFIRSKASERAGKSIPENKKRPVISEMGNMTPKESYVRSETESGAEPTNPIKQRGKIRFGNNQDIDPKALK